MSYTLLIGRSGALGDALFHTFSQGRHIITTYATRAPADTTPSYHLDLFDTASVKECVNALNTYTFARVIVNAGANENALLVKESPARFADHVAAFVIRMKNVVTAVADRMEGGHVIFISSLVGVRGGKGQATYAAVKGALTGLAQELAFAYAARDIRVNVIFPGVFRSRMSEGVSDARFHEMVRENILKRGQDVDEIARFAKCITEMRNVSGQVFNIDSRLAGARL